MVGAELKVPYQQQSFTLLILFTNTKNSHLQRVHDKLFRIKVLQVKNVYENYVVANSVKSPLANEIISFPPSFESP